MTLKKVGEESLDFCLTQQEFRGCWWTSLCDGYFISGSRASTGPFQEKSKVTPAAEGNILLKMTTVVRRRSMFVSPFSTLNNNNNNNGRGVGTLWNTFLGGRPNMSVSEASVVTEGFLGEVKGITPQLRGEDAASPPRTLGSRLSCMHYVLTIDVRRRRRRLHDDDVASPSFYSIRWRSICLEAAIFLSIRIFRSLLRRLNTEEFINLSLSIVLPIPTRERMRASAFLASELFRSVLFFLV